MEGKLMPLLYVPCSSLQILLSCPLCLLVLISASSYHSTDPRLWALIQGADSKKPVSNFIGLPIFSKQPVKVTTELLNCSCLNYLSFCLCIGFLPLGNAAQLWKKEASDIPSKSELLMFSYFT